MEKKLEVKNLQVSFRTQSGIVKAVRDISFDLYKGETLAIVGESGSGKSVTSKSVMGILSGNAIVEGGEIIYDGQDLLKISEEDFHKLRGDKIAMIFQDPMSSLNPIMSVGQQLTEAMILKNKTSKANARIIFNSTLKLLGDNIILANGLKEKKDVEEIRNLTKTFDDFCIESTILEGASNDALANLIDLKLKIERILFLIEKKQKINVAKTRAEMIKIIEESLNPYVLVKNQELLSIIDGMNAIVTKKNVADKLQLADQLQKLQGVIDVAINKKRPNFFRLGYYLLMNPNADVANMDTR